MDQTRPRSGSAAGGQPKCTPAAGPNSDVLMVGDTPGRRLQMTPAVSAQGTPCTPHECATMVDAVEEAIKAAAEATPGDPAAAQSSELTLSQPSGRHAADQPCDQTPVSPVDLLSPCADSGSSAARVTSLQSWLERSGVQLPTPAAKDLQALVTAAADNKRLRRQLEALREAELEMAAREAEENAQNFAILEEENLSLAADNTQLQQRLADLEALGARLEQERASALQASGGSCLRSQAVAALQKAVHTSRLSEVYEEQQLASFQQLDQAEQQLSAVKLQQPGGGRLQQLGVQDSLLQAEQNVQAAAAAAREASRRLALVLAQQEEVEEDLAGIRQQLEADPQHTRQHADLHCKLVEAQQALEDEKKQHQRMTGSLLEHAGRLSHKYYLLSDEHGVLQQRYRCLTSTNDELSSQLKEAHEMLYELQTAVQATPPAKRKECQRLMARVNEAEQAVLSLQQEKSQLHERLLQAQAFIACLQQHSCAANRRQPAAQMTPAEAEQPSAAQQAGPEADITPAYNVRAGSSMLPTAQQQEAARPGSPPAAAAPAAAAADLAAGEEMDSFVTPIKGRSNLVFDLPAYPADQPAASEPPPAIASFPADPVSPILRAAVATAASAPPAARQEQQQLQWSAARTELQHVQQEQLGLREEISKAKSALADIAGQLQASIGAAQACSGSRGSAGSRDSAGSSHRAVAPAAPASENSSAGSSGSSVRKTAPQPAGSAAGSRSSSAGGRLKASEGGGRASAAGRAATLSDCQASCLSAPASGKSAVPRSTVVGIQARRQHAAVAAGAATTGRAVGSSHSVGYIRAGTAAAEGADFTFPVVGHSSKQGQHTQSPSPDNAVNVPPGSQEQQQTATASKLHAATTSSSHRGQAADAQEASGSIAGSSGSAAKGSISLEQLIAEAESVSLEHGMSPAASGAVAQSCDSTSAARAAGKRAAGRGSCVLQSCPVQAAAAAQPWGAGSTADAGLQAALGAVIPAVQHTLQAAGSRLQAALLTPHSVVGSTGQPEDAVEFAGAAAGSPQHQHQLQQSWFTGPPVTPGSAASSAGPAAGPGRAALAQPGLQQEQQVTPLQPGCSGPGADAEDMQSAVRPAAAGRWQASTPMQEHFAATPPGVERVASNFPSPETGMHARGSAEDTPAAAGVVPWAAAWQHGQGELVTPSHDTPTALAARRQADMSDETSGLAAHMRRQQQLEYAGTAHCLARPAASAQSAPVLLMAGAAPGEATPAATLAGVRAAGGNVDVLQSAVALLASIGPAGLMGSPADVAPAQILQHLTPEWMRELKRRCTEGTQQVQQLRRQLGLSTPEPSYLSPACAGTASATPAASPAASLLAAAAYAAAAEREAEETVAAVAAVLTAAVAQASPAAATGSTPVGQLSSQPQLLQGQTSGSLAAAAAVEEAAVSSAAAGARSAIDKLRRRAMAQAAAAASSGAATPEAAESELPDARSSSSGAAAVSGLQAALATLAAAQGAGDDLERSDSAGSLAQYMAQQGTLRGRVLAPEHHRSDSGQLSSLPARPDCPTPGSAYSCPSERASPDVLLLAGLSSSRAMARRLQLQLQRQLERTASLPAMQGGDADSNRQPPSSSAEAAQARLLEQGSGGCNADLAGLQPVAAAAAADESTADVDEPGSPSAAACMSAAGLQAGTAASPTAATPPSVRQQTQSSLLLPHASPITPGAALNVLSESQLLSPGLQVQLLFDGAAQEAEQKEQSAAAEGASGRPSSDACSEVSGLEPPMAAAAKPECSAVKGVPAVPASCTGEVKARPAKQSGSSAVAAAGCSPAAPADSATASSTAADPSLSSWAGDAGACNTPSAAAAVSSRPPPGDVGGSQQCAPGASSVWQPPRIILGDSPSTARQARSRTAALVLPAASPEATTDSSHSSYSPAGRCMSSCTPSSCVASSQAQLSMSLGASPGSAAEEQQQQCWGESAVQQEQGGVIAGSASGPGAAAAEAGWDSEEEDTGHFEEVPLGCDSEGSAAIPSGAAGDMQHSPEQLLAAGAEAGAAVTPGGISWGSQVVGAAAAGPLAAGSARGSPAGSVSSAPAAAAGTTCQQASAAASSVSGSSCVFATPAMAFDSPAGGSAACSGSSHQAFYTVQQSRLPPGSSVTATKSVAASWAAEPQVVEPVAFKGFDTVQDSPRLAEPLLPACEQEQEQGQQIEASVDAAAVTVAADDGSADAGGARDDTAASAAEAAPVPLQQGPQAVAGPRATPAAIPAGGCGGPVSPAPASSQSSLLQQLLGTPGSEGCFSPELTCTSQHLQPGSWQAIGGAECVPASAGVPSKQAAGAAGAAASGGSSSSRADRQELPGSAGAASSKRWPGSAAVAGIPSGDPVLPIASQLYSPTLSELGFIAAPLSADAAAAAVPQMQQQGGLPVAGSSGSSAGSADLAGMPFQQRLALLCREDEEEGQVHQRYAAEPVSPLAAAAVPSAGQQLGSSAATPQPGSSNGSSSNSSLQALEQQEEAWLCANTVSCGSPAAAHHDPKDQLCPPDVPSCSSGSSAGGGGNNGGDDRLWVRRPELPAHLVCAATQTTPQLTRTQQRTWEGRDMQTQVSPALYTRGVGAIRSGGTPDSPEAAVAAGSTSAPKPPATGLAGRATEVAAAFGATCDVSASPVKMRDQA